MHTFTMEACPPGLNVFYMRGGPGQAEGRQGSLPWEEAAEGADDDLVSLRELVFQVMAATRQVAHAGTKTQLESAQAILRSTRKSLYQLLAEDDEPVEGAGP